MCNLKDKSYVLRPMPRPRVNNPRFAGPPLGTRKNETSQMTISINPDFKLF